jgi:hypothetical protein
MRAPTERAGRVRGRRWHLLSVSAVMASLAALAVAGPAQAHAPTGILAPFVQCPASTPHVELCIFSQITSGEVKIKTTTVPITNTVTLQAGLSPVPGLSGAYVLIPAKNGETLTKTEQNVPGGLTDLVNCTEIKGEKLPEKIERGLCKAIFENKFTGVTATVELVANATDPAIFDVEALFGEQGPTFILPVRIHLKNELLGNACYIGSEANPIKIELTDGTTKPPLPNKPIKGKLGIPFAEEEGSVSLIAIKENTLVNNEFSAPVAEGCGGGASGIIDPIIDAKLGLPSAAGNNTVILNDSSKLVGAEEVVESENK